MGLLSWLWWTLFQLVCRDEQHEPLNSSDKVLARLVLLGGPLVAQLNFHCPHKAVIRGQQLAYPAQPVGGGNLGLVLDEADVIDLQVLMTFSIFIPVVRQQGREPLLHPELPPHLGKAV